jgi:hypothetical protein
MNRERTALFLIGCMGSRFALAEGARRMQGTEKLANIAPLAFLPAFAFFVLFAFGLRKSGPETFGDPIWWDKLRPLHAILYALFAYTAMKRLPGSWRFLYADVSIGLLAWLAFHSEKIL